MCSAIKYQAVCQKDFTVHSPLFGRGTAALGDFLSSNRLKYGQLRVPYYNWRVFGCAWCISKVRKHVYLSRLVECSIFHHFKITAAV